MAQVAAKILLDAEFAPTVWPRLQKSLSQMERNLKIGNNLFNIRNVRDFSTELDRANQRVITLGIAFQSLRTAENTLSGIARYGLEVEKAFIEINSVFELTASGLDKFGKDLFNVARETSQSFQNVTIAAKELSRQGLSAEETLKRTRSALTLSRVAALDVTDAVNVLTASINGFSKAGLTSADVTNKLLAVDTKFAVSASDLAQALARSGAAASDAGVSFDELLGIVTAVQQTTARGGAVIGNALKTIFTRIERKDTIDALESLGVSVRNVDGSTRPAIELLTDFAKTYDQLGSSSKKSAAEIVGGVYQINILKAAIADLGRQRSIYGAAVDAAANATDEETKRNEALNQSLSATVTKVGLAAKQIGSNIANLGFSDFARVGLNLALDNPITKALEDASGKASTTGGKIAEGIISGIGSALVLGLGPVFLRALTAVSSSTFKKIKTDLLEASGITASSKEQAAIQAQINTLYQSGDVALKAQLATMTSLTDKARVLQAALTSAQSAVGQRQSETGAIANILYQRGYRIPRAAGGYVPFSEESQAIRMGIGGATPNATPKLIPNFNFGGGKVGPIVANTSEYVVPNFAGGGSAIFNQDMIRKYGMPPGATPVGASGYIPYAAKGKTGKFSDRFTTGKPNNRFTTDKVDPLKILSSKNFASILYKREDGQIARYFGLQHLVRRDLLVGQEPPKGYKTWAAYDNATKTRVLRSTKEGTEEADFRRFRADRILEINAGGLTYKKGLNFGVLNATAATSNLGRFQREYYAGGYIPNASFGYIYGQQVASGKTVRNLPGSNYLYGEAVVAGKTIRDFPGSGYSYGESVSAGRTVRNLPAYSNQQPLPPYIPASPEPAQYSGPFGFSSYLKQQTAQPALPQERKVSSKPLVSLGAFMSPEYRERMREYVSTDTSLGITKADLRSATGSSISAATLKRIQELFFIIEKAPTEEAARKLGKSLLTVSEGLNKASKIKVTDVLSSILGEFKQGLNISAIQSKIAAPPVGSAVFIPGGGGTLPPIPGSTVVGGGGGGGNRGIITAMGGLNPRNNPNLYIDPTTEERILKKYVEQLSNKQLASVVSGGRSGMGSFARPDLQQMIRGEFQTNPLSQFRIKTLVDFGKSGTLMTDFEKTVRSLVKSGTDLSDAYIKASNDFVAAGGTRKQLRTTQTVLLNSLIDYETGIKEATRQVLKTSSQQVSYNKAIAKLQAGAGFQDLDTRQRSILKSRIFGEEAQKLGFSQADILKNTEARQQVLEATNLRVQSLTNTPLLSQGTAKGINRVGNFLSGPGGLGVSLGLGFASGAIPEGRGGTSGGIASGALSGALGGAAFGLGIGSAFGPVGAVVGTGIGATIGGVVGAIGKLNESLSELTTRLEETGSTIQNDFSNALRALDLEEQQKNATEQGQVRNADRLRRQRLATLSQIRDPRFLQIIGDPNLGLNDARGKVEELGLQRGSEFSSQKTFEKLGFTGRETRNVFLRLYRNLEQNAGSEFLSNIFKTLETAKAGEIIESNEPLIKEVSGGLSTVLKGEKFNLQKLIDLNKLAQQDPIAALKTIGSIAGVDKKILASLDTFDPQIAGEIFSRAYTEASIAIRVGKDTKAPRTGESLILAPQIGRRLSQLRTQAFQQQIEAQGLEQFVQAGESNLLQRAQAGPELQALDLSAKFQLSAARRKAQNDRASALNRAQSTVLQTAKSQAPQGLTPEVFSELNNLNRLQDFINLREKLLDPKYRSGLPNLYSDQFLDNLNEAIEGLQNIDFEESKNLETIKSVSAELRSQALFRRTSTAAIGEQIDALKKYNDELDRARSRGESGETIEGIQANIDLTQLELDRRYDTSVFGLSPEDKYDAGVLRIKERQQLQARLRANRAFVNRDVNEQIDESVQGYESNLDFQIRQSKIDLETAKRINADEQVIVELRSKYADLLIEKRKYEGKITEEQARIESLTGRAFRLASSQYATRDKTESALLSLASEKGRQGDSIGSLVGGFGSRFAGIRKDLKDISDLGANIAQSLESNLGNAFGDFVTGAKSAKDAFRDFAISVLNDVSRMFASQAVRSLLGGLFGGIGVPTAAPAPAGATGGEFTGTAFRFAAGGKVPALLTGGEYVFNPQAAKEIGYDTLKRINRYANGGLVMGGSGVKDDVPAKLAPGSFVVKKSVVDRLGASYFDALANGGVQKRFLGGFIGMPMLYGALIGGGLGYVTGGKKGAIGGAILGGIAGGMYGMQQTAANTTAMQPIGPDGAPLQVSSAAKLSPTMQGVVGLGATVGLGLLAQGVSKPKKESQAISLAEVPKYAEALEEEERVMMGGARDRFAYLAQNSSGGYSLGSFGAAPATRRFADGGEVKGITSLSIAPFSDRGTRQFYKDDEVANATPLPIAPFGSEMTRRFANGGEVGTTMPLPIAPFGNGVVRRFADGGEVPSATPLSIGPSGGGSGGDGGSGPTVNVKIEINNNGDVSSSSSAEGSKGGIFGSDFGQKMEKVIRPIIQEELVRQMRNDGLFSQRSRYVNNF